MKKLMPLYLLLFTACTNGDKPGGETPPADQPRIMSYSIVGTLPHDTSSFTEGLLFYKGNLYESTGQYGASKLLKIDLQTGKALQSTSLDPKYFGEGIAIVNDTVYQLTYQEKTGLKYTLKDLKPAGNFSYVSAEGWGMTYDGTNIIASDGSGSLFYYEPGSFKLVKTLVVSESGSQGYNINELEYINGFIYANQWQTGYILKINPADGKIVAKADLSDLVNRMKQRAPKIEPGLNGIAYNDSTKKVYITGKYWPELYEVQFGE